MNYSLTKPFIYVNWLTKIHLKCNTDENEWNIGYDSFINGKHKCSKCSNHRKITQSEAYNIITNHCNEMNYILLNNDFKFIGIKNTKIQLKCDSHDHIWTTNYNSFINNKKGCYMCGIIKRSNSHKLTQIEAFENVKNRCEKINCILINNDFNYVGKDTVLHLRYVDEKKIWKTTYNSFVRGCVEYSKTDKQSKITQEIAFNKINEICEKKEYSLINNDFIFIGSNKTRIYLKCKKDGCEWNAKYGNLISRKGCPQCAINNRANSHRISQKNSEESIKKRCDEINCILLDDFVYESAKNTYFNLQCKKDLCSWKSNYSNFVLGKFGCPECAKKFKKSENKIKNLLESNNIKYVYQYRDSVWLGKLSLDFYLPEYNIAIEYQGKQHFKPIDYFGGEKAFEENYKRDIKKYNLCKKQGINLLYFTYENQKHIPNNYFSNVYNIENELIKKILNFNKI